MSFDHEEAKGMDFAHVTARKVISQLERRVHYLEGIVARGVVAPARAKMFTAIAEELRYQVSVAIEDERSQARHYGRTFQDECDREDEAYNRGYDEEQYQAEDTPSLELEGTVFDPNL